MRCANVFLCNVFSLILSSFNPHNNREAAFGQPSCYRGRERGNGQSIRSGAYTSVQALCLHHEWDTQLVLSDPKGHIYRFNQLQVKTLVSKPCIRTEYVQTDFLVLIPLNSYLHSIYLCTGHYKWCPRGLNDTRGWPQVITKYHTASHRQCQQPQKRGFRCHPLLILDTDGC